jgi:DNA-binding NarL/FixJ family response regulator
MEKGEGRSRLPSGQRQVRTAEGEHEVGSPVVVIADDHPFFRAALGHSLRASGIDVAAEVGSGEAAIHAVREFSPQVVVMDLKMPGLSGVEATRRLAAAHPGTHMVVVSVSGEEGDVIEAALAGASGYVLKDSPPQELVAAIHGAAAGEPLVSARIAAALLGRIREAISTGEGLAGVSVSGRELEILDAFAGGKREDEVADSLGLSPHEVRDHVSNLLMKLRVDSAVRDAIRKLDA